MIVLTAKARDHYLMANIVPIAWVQAMINKKLIQEKYNVYI